jgi:hypothetical protein
MMSVKSRQLLSLNFGAQDLFEATVPASLSTVLLHRFLCISLLCCPWRFKLKTCFFMAEESFFNVKTNPLPFLQFHVHYHWFLMSKPCINTDHTQYMVVTCTCTKPSYYNVHMRYCNERKHKKLSSKHKFPVLHMPDIHLLPLGTTSTWKS